MLKLVRRHGSPNWYIRGTIAGQPVEESTRVADRDAARRILEIRAREILERRIDGPKATATFLEAAVAYMETITDRRFIAPLIDHFGDARLADIDQGAIDRAARILYPTAKPSTWNRQVYTPMSAILRHGAALKLTDLRIIKRPKQPKGKLRWLRPEEAEALIEACGDHLRPLVIFMLYTGARVSEAIYIPWDNVNLQERRVWFDETKNGEARGVPLHERAWLELANLPHIDRAVFRTHIGVPYKRSERKSGGQIQDAFTSAVKRAKLVAVTPHTLRHTWATWHYAANRDLLKLMQLGGWKSLAMVQRYAHVNPDHLADSIDRLPWGKSGESDTAELKNKGNSNA